jgi:hypothetical protein
MAPRTDLFLADCVICAQPAVALGIAFGADRGQVKLDFCPACIANGEDVDNFGRCYVCRDFHDHNHCIGVPCQCPCPAPGTLDEHRLREQALAKLTPDERRALGVL